MQMESGKCEATKEQPQLSGQGIHIEGAAKDQEVSLEAHGTALPARPDKAALEAELAGAHE